MQWLQRDLVMGSRAVGAALSISTAVAGKRGLRSALIRDEPLGRCLACSGDLDYSSFPSPSLSSLLDAGLERSYCPAASDGNRRPISLLGSMDLSSPSSLSSWSAHSPIAVQAPSRSLQALPRLAPGDVGLQRHPLSYLRPPSHSSAYGGRADICPPPLPPTSFGPGTRFGEALPPSPSCPQGSLTLAP